MSGVASTKTARGPGRNWVRNRPSAVRRPRALLTVSGVVLQRPSLVAKFWSTAVKRAIVRRTECQGTIAVSARIGTS